jgi:hypothetical protein
MIATTAILVAVLPACSSDSPPLRPSNPCCHILLAGYEQDNGAQQSYRRGPEPQATWSKVENVLAPTPPLVGLLPGRVLDVTQSSVVGTELSKSLRQTHEIFATGGSTGSLRYRNQDQSGTFGGLITLPNAVPFPGGGGPLGSSGIRFADFFRVSSTMSEQNLHVCAVGSPRKNGTVGSGDKFYLYHARRAWMPAEKSDGTPVTESERWAVGSNVSEIWDDVALDGAGERDAEFHDVSCVSRTDPQSGVERLNVCAVTMDGRLLHSARNTDGSYSPFVDLGKLFGDDDSYFQVSCTSKDGIIYLVATAAQSLHPGAGEPTAKFAVRTATNWRLLADVRIAASVPPFSDLGPVYDVAIGFCNMGVGSDPRYSQLNVALLRGTSPAGKGPVTTAVFTQAAQTWSPLWPPSQWMPSETIPNPASSPDGTYGGISLAEQPFLPY